MLRDLGLKFTARHAIAGVLLTLLQEPDHEISNAVFTVLNPTGEAGGSDEATERVRRLRVKRYEQITFADKSCGKSKQAKHGPITPWEWARYTLLHSKDSRNAYVRFSLPSHQWFINPEPPRVMHALFRVRDEALHLSLVVRAWCAVTELPCDLFWFGGLIDRMREDVKSHYPDLKRGHLTVFAHSLYVPKESLSLAERMLIDYEQANAAA